VVGFLALLAISTGCSSDSSTRAGSADSLTAQLNDDAVTVGSFDFTESAVLAEVYSQGLEAAGFTVHRAFRLGPREFVGSALSTGLVEFVPDYAGTAAQFFSLGKAAPTVDATAAHQELADALGGEHVVALNSAPAQDANTFVVKRATAARLKLHKLSDLKGVAGDLAFGGPPECPARPLCLQGLAHTYGLKFGSVVTTDAGGPLTHTALDEGIVDVALLFTTDPQIADDDLVELADDRGLQPAESVTPLVRTEVLDRLGSDVVATTNAISAKLTTDVVRQLNRAADEPGSDVGAVAAAWWSQVSS
jgi:osmoprotectant transport system substrate-binding protein